MRKYRQMTRKQKKEHMLEYYKYHMLGGAFAFFIVISILYAVLGPKPAEPAVNVVVMGLYSHTEGKIDEFKEAIENSIDNGESGKVEVDMLHVDWDEPSSMSVALNQKLMLLFKSKEIDVMIVEESKFDSYIESVQDCIYESLDDQAGLLELLEDNEDYLVKRKIAGDTSEKVYGLYAKDNKKLQEIGLGDDFVISVPTVSDKKENAFKTIKWLYQ